MKCAREGCHKQALGDEFCSAHCFRVSMGLEEHKRPPRSKAREFGPVDTENKYVNRERHIGPSPKTRARHVG